MKLIDTFEIVEDVLYAGVFDEPKYNGVNEFRRLMDLWTDRDFLAKYFERNTHLLQTSYWSNVINGDFNSNVSLVEAVNKTIEDAIEFEKRILKIAKGKVNGKGLNDLFIPLHKEIKHNRKDDEYKAYGIKRNSWLRFYAIQIENNQYYISGGGIKLTLEMKDSEGLNIELNKLEKVYSHLMGF